MATAAATLPNQTIPTMKKLPFYFLGALFAAGLVWADRDAAAGFKRCRASHSVDYCRAAYWGR